MVNHNSDKNFTDHQDIYDLMECISNIRFTEVFWQKLRIACFRKMIFPEIGKSLQALLNLI